MRCIKWAKARQDRSVLYILTLSQVNYLPINNSVLAIWRGFGQPAGRSFAGCSQEENDARGRTYKRGLFVHTIFSLIVKNSMSSAGTRPCGSDFSCFNKIKTFKVKVASTRTRTAPSFSPGQEKDAKVAGKVK